MAMNIYSLSDYKLNITIPENFIKGVGAKTLEIGGTESFVGSIRVSRSTNTWSISPDATGSYVFNKTYDISGTVEVDINQTSDTVVKLAMLMEAYITNKDTKDKTLTMTITSAYTSGNIVELTDVMPTKIAPQSFGRDAASQSWSFIAGQVKFKQSTKW